MEWIKNLIAEAENWDKPGEEPDDDVAENEKVLGEVPEDLKKAMGYFNHLAGQAEKMFAEHRRAHRDPKHDTKSCEKFSREISEIAEKAEFLHKIFWKSLRASLKISANSIGLRKGWKVVECQEEDSESRIIRVVTVMG